MNQYSLFQRFQGALVGRAIGQLYFADVAIGETETAMRHCIHWLCQPAAYDPPQLGQDALRNALNLLPLWLYCHDSWRSRQRWLEQIPGWRDLSSEQPIIWLYGEAIAQAVRADCQPQHLIRNLGQRWQQHTRAGAPELPEIWRQRLAQIQQWQQVGRCLAPIQSALTDDSDAARTITASLLCFLQSPEDLTVALARSRQLVGSADSMSGALLGGLLGAYCGWIKLPIHHILRLVECEATPAKDIALCNRDVFDLSMVPFTDETCYLLQAWSGSFQSSESCLHASGPQLLVAPILASR